MKTVLRALAVAMVLFAGGAIAGEIKPYSQAGFDALAAEGRPIVIAVHAGWCPTCKAQAPIQSNLMSRPDFRDYTVLIVDFDTEKPLLRKLKVSTQSTLIVYKGKSEVGRSVGDTSPQGIESLFRKAKA